MRGLKIPQLQKLCKSNHLMFSGRRKRTIFFFISSNQRHSGSKSQLIERLFSVYKHGGPGPCPRCKRPRLATLYQFDSATDDAETAATDSVSLSHEKLANVDDVDTTRRQLEPAMVECRKTWSNTQRCGYKRKIESACKQQILHRKLRDEDGLLASVGIHV